MPQFTKLLIRLVMKHKRSYKLIISLVVFSIVGTLIGSSGGLVVCVSSFGEQAVEFLHDSHEINHHDFACHQSNDELHNCDSHQSSECEDNELQWELIHRATSKSFPTPLIHAYISIEKPLQIACLSAIQPNKYYLDNQISLDIFTSHKLLASTILQT
ncbi:hypothetical protein JD969_18800 [Planctomycetota bacterium]|nr:hypothetical protein JD969_18800 [Planctomycetota bacterium]